MRYSKTILAAAMAMTWMSGWSVDLPELPAQEGKNLKGYVHDGTAGIPGVLVTDGYTFARTGEDGSYYLAGNNKAWCVYVILPSGYEYGTVEQGIVKHFVTLDKSLEEQQADFQLNPIGDDSTFSFIVHADSQPSEYIASECWNGMKDAYTDMQATGASIKAEEGFMPFNLHMGDIIYNTNDVLADYRKYKNNLIASGYTIPMLTTPGNHDRRYKADYMEATELYREEFGPLWYSFNRGAVHFVAVDNVKVVDDGEYTRGICDDAVEWLKKDLSYVDKETPIVFFTHQPMTRNSTATKAYKTVLDMLKAYNTLILTGHLHKTYNNFPVYDKNIRERNKTAVAGYEWRGPCSCDGTPLGYSIYTVNGKEFSWKFKWTKRDPDKYMFRMYTPGDLGAPNFNADEAKTVYINVWDWDDAWKVTWRMQEDGETTMKDMGDLPMCKDTKDPWAVYNYEGRTNKDYDCGTSYHLFHADVPNTCSKIEVTVEDRFGRKSTSSLSLKHISGVGGVETVSAETSGVAFTEVYDLSGVKVFSTEGYPHADTLPLDAGVYVYRLTNLDGSVSVEKNVVK